MTVQELIELLKDVDGDRIVVIAKDAEGNQFTPLFAVDDESTYLPYNTWSGEIGLEILTPELRAQGYTDADIVGGDPALVLWPVN